MPLSARSMRHACPALGLLALAACGAGNREIPAPTPALPAVRLQAMGPVAPDAAPGQSLWLAHYEIAPGTALKPHYHEGTQIGLVLAGTLTYTVFTGEVPVYRIGPDGKSTPLSPVKAGETREIGANEWVVEHRDSEHVGANRGSVPLVIVTSSLLREGAPLATLLPQ